MKIEVLEKKFLDGSSVYLQGEVREVSQEDGEYFCSLGWAKDVTGKIKTGARQKSGEVRLDIRSTRHTVVTEEIGGNG